MPTPDWVTTEDWDALYLGDVRMPGTARVEVDMPSGVDIKKPKGGRRARVRDTGSPPAKLDIELILMPSDMPAFERYLPILRPRAIDGVMDPISIAHPNARLWGINVVLVDSISSPMPTTGGWLKIRIKAVEWVPEPKAVKKPKTAPKPPADVAALTDALNELPMSGGAAEENFTSAEQIEGSGF